METDEIYSDRAERHFRENVKNVSDNKTQIFQTNRTNDVAPQ